MPSDWLPPDADPLPPRPAVTRSWRTKFAEAFHGVKLGIRGQASFCVHFFFAVLAALLAVVLECDRFEWCLIVLCIGLVLTAELFNSALETLFHGLDAETKSRLVGVLDIAAGAVLVASITALIVGVAVFAHRLAEFADISL